MGLTAPARPFSVQRESSPSCNRCAKRTPRRPQLRQHAVETICLPKACAFRSNRPAALPATRIRRLAQRIGSFRCACGQSIGGPRAGAAGPDRMVPQESPSGRHQPEAPARRRRCSSLTLRLRVVTKRCEQLRARKNTAAQRDCGGGVWVVLRGGNCVGRSRVPCGKKSAPGLRTWQSRRWRRPSTCRTPDLRTCCSEPQAAIASSRAA